MITTFILSYFNSSDVFNTDTWFHIHFIQISCNSFSLSIVRVKSQSCDGMSQYDRCSRNSACACFHLPGASNTGICTDRYAVTCSELTPCNRSTNSCSQSDHICVHHPQCHDIPVCYSVPNSNKQFCPPIATNIPANAKWTQNGVTIAGGHGKGDATNQFSGPYGLFVDDDQTVVIADYGNHRIMQWKNGDTPNGQVVAGGKGEGNGLHQLYGPTDVLIDKETDSLIICDAGNRRVVRWSRRSGTTQGEILIDSIDCYGVAMDEQRYLYVSDYEKHEVRRYQLGEKNGTLVAGGNGKGDGLNQLNLPRYLFVDRQQTVYVSDHLNHRVMKWNKGAKEGIVVAGGEGEGNALTQLSYPNGIFVDTLGTLVTIERKI
ncbi:unnamed protein product [Rotaria socialis]|uniref:Uncharacterized protein n=1 Tax=Rotaria socialis TaxID=392032 RepID=A0A818KVG6_9BILA|nr:unnamed protein product [Rotaria socialis]CAF3566940.1 unnamed protein product [Rotaria socialis]CAF3752632.1 unnamed protein product [Rotaria socialis]